MRSRDRRAAWMFVSPAVGVIALVALFPLAWTVWESFHHHDLRMPWLGRPFVGLANYVEILSDPRFVAALMHTLVFTVISVALELVLGLALAISLNRVFRGRGVIRAATLVPWAIPTVVAGLLWRFMFQSGGIVDRLVLDTGLVAKAPVWFSHPIAAWVPLILADVWKTTPFVALLLLAGLQGIPAEVWEAAAVDGAGAASRLFRITIPILRPAILVTAIFRTLDAFRLFDLVYVLTGGGPGTATEPIALYTFNTLFETLRFGYGSALSVVVFLVTFALAMLYIRAIGSPMAEER
ncbi:MAG: sugar ABC transporter permease [Thermoanaerobaculia bacterium]